MQNQEDQPVTPRQESAILEDLAKLVGRPGYAHVIAFFCYRDNFISFDSKELHAEDIGRISTPESLSRTEISTLIGLLLKSTIDLSVPTIEEMGDFVTKTQVLLEELHASMSLPMFQSLLESSEMAEPPDFVSGNVLKEAIFYGGESAYHFQYRELAEDKYRLDRDWIKCNLGFAMEQAVQVTQTIQYLQNTKLKTALDQIRAQPEQHWSVLQAFEFSTAEVASASGLDQNTVRGIVESFTADQTSDAVINFSSIGDFNPNDGYPIIAIGQDQFLVFQSYTLLQALYETPFYLMLNDKVYSSTATANRGAFTEQYSADRLFDPAQQLRTPL